MTIKIQYQTTPEHLASASLFFLEKKPLVNLSSILFNILAVLLSLMIILKIFLIKNIAVLDLAGFFFCMLWVFGRRPLTHKLLLKRILSQGVFQKMLTILVSKNGLVWQGEGLKQGNLSWQDLKMVYKLSNGYLLPTNAARFLWVPFEGFIEPAETNQFEQYCREMNIKVKNINRRI